MSGTYTLPLWKVIKLTGGTVSRTAEGVRVMTGGDIGLNYFKCYEPDHKEILVGKIIDHYWNQEIGVETISMFQLSMQRKMNEIMPYYNKLYETETLQFDPISTIKLHTVVAGQEVVDADSTGNSDIDATTTSKSRSVQSQFPQVMLNGSGDYATAGSDVNSEGTSGTNTVDSRESNSTTTSDVDNTVEGYQAYPSRLLQQYRDTLLNIDMMIVADLSDCFMSVWNNADDYNPRGGGLILPFGI